MVAYSLFRHKAEARWVSIAYCGKALQENLPSVSLAFPFFPKIGESKSGSSIIPIVKVAEME